MRPRPEHVREIDYPNFDYSKDMDTLIKFILKKWDGVKKLMPKGYKEFCKDYEDFKGMDEEGQKVIAQDIKDFKSFDDNGSCCGSFPERVSLAHTAYDVIGQGGKPWRTLFGALVAHGHARGELFGKRDAYDHAACIVTHAMICTLRDRFGKGKSEETNKALYEMISAVSDLLYDLKKGLHHYGCKCELCHIENDLTPKEKETLGEKVKDVTSKEG